MTSNACICLDHSSTQEVTNETQAWAISSRDGPAQGWENLGPPTTPFLLAMTLVRTGPLTRYHSFSVLEGDCGLEVNWAERLCPPSYDSFLGGVTEAQGEKGAIHMQSSPPP